MDNNDRYGLWYFALTPEAAVGEVFGNLDKFTDDMFLRDYMPHGRQVLGTYSIDEDEYSFLDLDDPNNLKDRALRPTQIVARNRATTQAWALKIFEERRTDGKRKWAGVRWWSFQRPNWVVFGLWVEPGEDLPFTYIEHQDLNLNHAAVVAAADALTKEVVP